MEIDNELIAIRFMFVSNFGKILIHFNTVVTASSVHVVLPNLLHIYFFLLSSNCLLRAPLNRFDILYTRECFISIMVFRLTSPQTKLSYQTGKLTLTLIRHDTQKRPSQQRTIFYSLDMSIIKKQQSLLIMTIHAK